jgi:glycosyltransferase involved in cell wall biosynthesis
MSDPTVSGHGVRNPLVAVVAETGGVAPLVGEALAQIAERGIPGWESDLILSGRPAASGNVDSSGRGPAASGNVDSSGRGPAASGNVDSSGRGPAAAADALAGSHCDLVHVWTSGPLGTAWLRAAQARDVPAIATYDPAAPALGYYDLSALVLSPCAAADARLFEAGVGPERIARLRRGVDMRLYHPARYSPEVLPEPPERAFNVLHVGGRSLELASDAFLIAHDRSPQLRLVLAGAGRRAGLPKGASALLLPQLDREQLASVLASSDMLLVTDTADVFGDWILEAQASGLPVLAVDAGAAPELIANGRSGCLVPPDPAALAAAIRGLARRATVLERLATGGLLAIRERSWDISLAKLADAYRLAARARAPIPEVARAA